MLLGPLTKKGRIVPKMVRVMVQEFV